MYTIMAKAEEVTQAMKTVQNHALRMYPLKKMALSSLSHTKGSLMCSTAEKSNVLLIYLKVMCDSRFNIHVFYYVFKLYISIFPVLTIRRYFKCNMFFSYNNFCGTLFRIAINLKLCFNV